MSLKSIFAALRTKPPVAAVERQPEMPILDQNGEVIDDPILRRVVNNAYDTGEAVFWNEGDGLPPRSNSG